MNHEEHDDLWRLLGQARVPTVSPFFSRNVLRAIREEAERPNVFTWLRRRWHVTAIGAAALLIAGATAFEHVSRPDPVLLLAQQVSTSPDYQVIGQLDELLDSERNSVWLDK